MREGCAPITCQAGYLKIARDVNRDAAWRLARGGWKV